MASRLVTLLQEAAVAGTYLPRRIGRSKNDPAFPGLGDGIFRDGACILEINRGANPPVGALTIFGANASDPNGNPNQQNSGTPLAQEFKGDGATTAFQSLIPYVAFSNYNWVLEHASFVGTGTVSTTAGSNVLTGSGTAFLSTLFPGDTVVVAGERQVIALIVSDTVAWTESNWVATNSAVAFQVAGAPIPTAAYTMSSGTGGNALCTMATAPAANVRFRLFYSAVTTVFGAALGLANSRALKIQIPTYDFMWCLLGATPSPTSVWLRPLRSQG